VDLKLPSEKLTRRQLNRDRFAAVISEARAQLQHYGKWFQSEINRASLTRLVGMEIYEPRLGVVIGRSREFHSPYDRQKLSSGYPDLDVVTYDDIVEIAKRRRALMQGASPWSIKAPR
jgi:hypothetical protein